LHAAHLHGAGGGDALCAADRCCPSSAAVILADACACAWHCVSWLMLPIAWYPVPGDMQPHAAAPLAVAKSMPTCTRWSCATADSLGCIYAPSMTGCCSAAAHRASAAGPPGGNVSPATLAAVHGTSSGIPLWNTSLGACGSTPFSWHRASPAIPLGTDHIPLGFPKPGAQRSAVRWTCVGYDAD
jgi:hypothetical protein